MFGGDGGGRRGLLMNRKRSQSDGVRVTLRVTAQQAALIREAGGTEDAGLDSRADAMTHQEYSWMNASDAGWRGYVGRALSWGDWFSFLFWQPFRFHAIKWLNVVSVLAGWLVAQPILDQVNLVVSDIEATVATVGFVS